MSSFTHTRKIQTTKELNGGGGARVPKSTWALTLFSVALNRQNETTPTSGTEWYKCNRNKTTLTSLIKRRSDESEKEAIQQKKVSFQWAIQSALASLAQILVCL